MENFRGWSNKALRYEMGSMDEIDRKRAAFELNLREGQGMSERQHEEQPALPDMELVNIIEGMPYEDRIANKRQWLSEISDREMLCRMVDDANAGEGLEVAILY